MGQVPGVKPPEDFFSKWCVPAFLGGFGGGLLVVAVAPNSIALFFLFGIVGGGVGLTVMAKIEGVKFDDPWQALTTIAPIALGICYVSLPGAFLALIMFR